MKNRYLEKCAQTLFKDASDRDAFLKCFESPQEESSCIIWLKEPPPQAHELLNLQDLNLHPRLHVSRIKSGTPGRLPWHEEGYYYILDHSSVLSAGILAGVACESPRILDLCASPGGKSVLAHRMLSPSLLVSNEAIGGRVKKLISNLKRCDIRPCGVWSADAAYLSKKFPESFDVVIVDAPCSGQSILVKGGANPGAFHPMTVRKNAQRQKRILMESAALAQPGGYLAYMTCTYSVEENEGIIAWFLKKNPDYEVITIPSLKGLRSSLSPFASYRVWPQMGLGAGSFAVLLRKGGQPRSLDVESQFPYIWKNGI